MKYAVKLMTDGSSQILSIPDHCDFTWYAQEIGCEWIEIVRPRNSKYVLIVDEEGLLKDNKMNPHASAIYGFLKHGQPIAGDALILKEEMGDEGPELTGVDGEVALGLKNILDSTLEDVIHQLMNALSK